VIILGDADRLVVQDSSQEAANALLKVLEEPPADTTLILTSSKPDALLPTIRSRLAAIRVGRLTDAEVQNLLETELGTAPAEASRIAQMADGSVTRALAVAKGVDRDTQAAQRFLGAVRRGPEAWAGEAMLQAPWGARGGFSAMLDALALELRLELRRKVNDEQLTVDGYVEAIRLVEKHRAGTQQNLNPQLALAVLANGMAEVL
jgi:DNA polymerase-3 subunit delta'